MIVFSPAINAEDLTAERLELEFLRYKVARLADLADRYMEGHPFHPAQSFTTFCELRALIESVKSS